MRDVHEGEANLGLDALQLQAQFLPQLGIDLLKAKIDTGARSSALHVDTLETFDRDGVTWLRFGMHVGPRQPHEICCEAPALDRATIRCLPGNHDLPAVMREELAQWSEPVTDVGAWRVVTLDTTVPGSDAGHLPASQLDLLEAALAEAPGRHTLVAMHHNPMQIDSHWHDTMMIDNPQALFKLLAPQIADAGLRRDLETAASAREESLRVSALNASNEHLRKILIRLHAHLDETGADTSPVWDVLKAMAARRTLTLPG